MRNQISPAGTGWGDHVCPRVVFLMTDCYFRFWILKTDSSFCFTFFSFVLFYFLIRVLNLFYLYCTFYLGKFWHEKQLIFPLCIHKSLWFLGCIISFFILLQAEEISLYVWFAERAYVMNGYCSWSNAFSASINMIIRFSSFKLLVR